MNPEIDDRDFVLIRAKQLKRDAMEGPRLGDFVRMPDGTLRRFTYDWGDSIQTTMRELGGSFFLCDNGGCSYSGALDLPILKSSCQLLDEVMQGDFWCFHHDYYTAFNGVYFKLPCRVYKCIHSKVSLERSGSDLI